MKSAFFTRNDISNTNHELINKLFIIWDKSATNRLNGMPEIGTPNLWIYIYNFSKHSINKKKNLLQIKYNTSNFKELLLSDVKSVLYDVATVPCEFVGKYFENSNINNNKQIDKFCPRCLYSVCFRQERYSDDTSSAITSAASLTGHVSIASEAFKCFKDATVFDDTKPLLPRTIMISKKCCKD